MAELSTLFINIASKFDSSGLDKAIDKIEEASKKAKNITDGFKSAGLALSAFAVAGVAGLTTIARSAIEAEKATSELASAMKNAGVYTEEAYKHNLEYAKSLAEITTADDETIMSIQKILTLYGAQGEELDKLTKATLDFASARGIDAVSAGELLAKTIGSETNALARYGIEVEGSAGSVRRMESAVEGITALFGGSAQAQAQTFAGRMTKLRNEFEDLLETLGTYLFPVLDTLIEYLRSLIRYFQNLPPEVQNLIVQLSVLATAGSGVAGAVLLLIANLSSLIVKLAQVGDAIKILNLAMKGAGTIGIVLALATAIYGLVEAYGAWAKATDERKGQEARDLKTTEGKINNLKEINRVLELEGTKAKQAGKDTAWFTDKIEDNNRAIERLTKKLRDEEKAKKSLGETTEKLNEKEIKDMMAVKKADLQMHKIRLDDYEKFLRETLKLAKSGSQEELSIRLELYATQKAMFDEWRQTITGGWMMFVGDISRMHLDFSKVFMNLYSDMASAVSDFFVNMYEQGVDTWDKLSKVADTLWQAIKMAVVRQIADMVAQVIVKFAFLKAQVIAQALVDLAISFATTAGKLMSGFSSIPFVGWLLGLGAVGVAKSWFDGLKGEVRSLAKGGLALAPTMAMVGDAGIANPEVIMPLKSPEVSRLLGEALTKSETNIGGNTLNITVPYNAIPDRRNARKMAKVLGDEISRTVFNNRKV